MWTYDGEEWIEEGGSPDAIKRPEQTSQFEMFYPELQVVEIVPVPQTNYVPPLPLP
jgi:hypothetical protein